MTLAPDLDKTALDSTRMGQLLSQAAKDRLPLDKTVPVIVCGGSLAPDIGPMVSTPCKPPGISARTGKNGGDERFDFRFIPGVSQEKPADLMLGEETQIAGFLSLTPDFDGVVCLPNRYTKWAHISAGEIVSFRTFMTGEISGLLSRYSVLQHAVSTGGWDETLFRKCVGDAMSSPQNVSSWLFSLFAGQSLGQKNACDGRSRLTGWLVGAELAAARSYWLGREVVVIGATEPSAQYRSALAECGAFTRSVSADDCALAGLKAARAGLKN